MLESSSVGWSGGGSEHTLTVLGATSEWEYRTLQGTPPTGDVVSGQTAGLQLPSGGWCLAPEDADTMGVAAEHGWRTHALVLATGRAVATLHKQGEADLVNALVCGPSGYRPSPELTTPAHVLLRRPAAGESADPADVRLPPQLRCGAEEDATPAEGDDYTIVKALCFIPLDPVAATMRTALRAATARSPL